MNVDEWKWTKDGEAPFAVRIVRDEIHAERERRGWERHGYEATYAPAVVRACGGVRTQVWVVAVWENSNTQSNSEEMELAKHVWKP